MLSKAIAQQVEKVMGYFGENQRAKAKKNPEACVLSMLTLIEKELHEVSATLQDSIQLTTCDDYLRNAQEKIKQADESS